MKNWLEKNKAFFRGWKFKLGMVLFFIILILGIFIGTELYGYVMAVCVFLVFYYFTLQARSEHIISPKEQEQMVEDLRELEEEAAFIREHIAENPGDLDAKLLLREVERGIEEMKATLEKE